MFSFALFSFSCFFYENLDKIYQEIPCFSPFIQPFTPLVFIGKVYFGMLEKRKNIMAGSKLAHQEPAIFLSFYANLNLSELSTTLTLEKAIRALAHIGVI